MDHSSVVLSLIRVGLLNDTVAFTKQVKRLRTRLVKDEDHEIVDKIDQLLSSTREVQTLKPCDVVLSRSLITGETLTRETLPPIDRETGGRLCEIDFPRDTVFSQPIYDETVNNAIEGFLSEWLNADRLKQLDVEPTRSLLIFGPPGSGKTLTAHHIANRIQLPLVIARIDGLISSFLGTTSRNIANLFEFANRYKCILLLDEFDAIAKLRDDPQEVGEIKRVVNTLLQNLDLRRNSGITIAITNHDRLLDPAVWRRFETQLHISEPEAFTREEIIKHYLKPLNVDCTISQLLSICLKGSSGADLQRLCNSLKRIIAVENMNTDAQGIFKAFSILSTRLPTHENCHTKLLAHNIEAFISYVAADRNFPLTQSELGHITGKDQSTISRLKKQHNVMGKEKI